MCMEDGVGTGGGDLDSIGRVWVLVLVLLMLRLLLYSDLSRPFFLSTLGVFVLLQVLGIPLCVSNVSNVSNFRVLVLLMLRLLL